MVVFWHFWDSPCGQTTLQRLQTAKLRGMKQLSLPEILQKSPRGTPSIIKFSDAQNSKSEFLGNLTRKRNISAVTNLILTKLYMQVPGPSLTDANCHSDIFPGNLCPGDICPVHIQTISAFTNLILTKHFWTQFFKVLNFC